MKPRRFIYLLALFCIANVNAQDWPQFPGPESGPEVLWNVDVGIGYGGPVVKDGQVYLLDRDDEVGDKLRCFDLSNGEVLWEYTDWICSIPVPSAVMIKVEKGADGLYHTTELFKTEEFGDQTKPPILHEGYLYAQYGTPGTCKRQTPDQRSKSLNVRQGCRVIQKYYIVRH